MSNSIIEQNWEMFGYYQSLRPQLLDIISDADLSYTPGGNAMTLGALCREMGETEYAYIESFKSFKSDFSYKDEAQGKRVDGLRSWYEKLDVDLKAVVSGLSEDDVQNKKVDRGGGFLVSPYVNLMIYQEALLLFYGKASIYIRAMGKELPEQWAQWIG